MFSQAMTLRGVRLPASKRACSPLARVLAILSRMLGPTAVVTRSAVMIRAITSCPAGADGGNVAHHVQLLIRAHHVHLVLLAVAELVDQGSC